MLQTETLNHTIYHLVTSYNIADYYSDYDSTSLLQEIISMNVLVYCTKPKITDLWHDNCFNNRIIKKFTKLYPNPIFKPEQLLNLVLELINMEVVAKLDGLGGSIPKSISEILNQTLSSQ